MLRETTEQSMRAADDRVDEVHVQSRQLQLENKELQRALADLRRKQVSSTAASSF